MRNYPGCLVEGQVLAVWWEGDLSTKEPFTFVTQLRITKHMFLKW